MAIGSTIDFNLTGQGIIQAAIALAANRNSEIPIEPHEIAEGLNALNRMVKAWQGQPLHLWKRDEGILFLRTGVSEYKIGGTGTDQACLADDFVNTEIATAAVTNDTDLVVDSSTGMSGAPDVYAVNQATLVGSWAATLATIAVASDKLTVTNSGAAAGYAEVSLTGLVVGNNYRVKYGYELGTSTSCTFSVISDSVVLSTATLTATDTSVTMDFTATQTTGTFRCANVSTTSCHTSLCTAMNYVDKSTGDYIGIKLDDLTRQWLKIVSISSNTLSLNGAISGAAAVDNSVFTFPTLVERPLRVEDARRTMLGSNSEIKMEEWARQEYFAQPNKTSTGTPTAFYFQPRLDQGRMHIWQTASNVDQLVKFTFARSFADFDTATNNPDFPAEWLDALVYNLAERLAIEYQTPLNRFQIIQMKAAELLEAVLGWDEEDNSLNLQPDFN